MSNSIQEFSNEVMALCEASELWMICSIAAFKDPRSYSSIDNNIPVTKGIYAGSPTAPAAT